MPQIRLQHLRLDLESSVDDIAFSTFIEALSLPVLEELWLDGQAVRWPATAS
ncbi:hypothetical protein M378DRAFT_166848 [Amanita muscaria Koide BX008]|uniref:Uncharacterized protein n=1 Tax=Amanita muscaria (strain Koide BX008) TaxID=946122 RepID=A0A0C2WYT6_AMAMK|nr:hypothetical protein M378DRAFT_166848 [Amanita muscaria Koide BX008]